MQESQESQELQELHRNIVKYSIQHAQESDFALIITLTMLCVKAYYLLSQCLSVSPSVRLSPSGVFIKTA